MQYDLKNVNYNSNSISPTCICGNSCTIGCSHSCAGPCEGRCGGLCSASCGAACHVGGVSKGFSG